MFVVSENARAWGVGKLVGRNGQAAQVEYFFHPGPSGRRVRTLASSGIRPVKLEIQTRAYFRRGNGHWHAGMVAALHDEAVEVQCGRRPPLMVPLAEVYVRCDQLLDDPAPFLAASLLEPCRLSWLRRRFLHEAVLQRAVGAGLEGLLSACVELHPHQMNVVRQVLTDPVQRYLLADEVGLGKTIEAAAIIRQSVIDDPVGHRIVVVAPQALVGQWRDELARRFHLGPPFLDESVRVVHAHDEDLEEALHGVRMMVVDEAHHIVAKSTQERHTLSRLESIREACCKAQSLLLLSATPAIADEEGFFALMQLIDPELYPASEREAFHQRIAHRQELAQIIAGFEPALMGFLIEDGKRLQEIFPDDARLAELLEVMAPIAHAADDPEQPELVGAVRAVRQHLSETYRLHRRILRNRRKNAQGLTPRRSGALRIEYADPTAGHIGRQLENWRLEVAEQAETDADIGASYAEWVRLLLEAPVRLAPAVRTRLDAVALDAPREAAHLERLLMHLDGWDPLQARIEALLKAVEAHGSPRGKLVVFCSDTTAADRCFHALVARHGSAIVRHEAQADGDPDDQAPWQRFLRSPDCWVLLCDARAEEGLNLQGGRKTVVHVDLPLAPNRIEQRLGRVDRFGSGDPIRSLVLTCTDSEVEQAWAECVIEGFGVMEQSIASLQYLVDAEMAALRRDLGTAGLSAVTELKVRLGGEDGDIRTELRRIDQQDALEALQSEDSESFECLDDADDDWQRVRDAVEPWLRDGLRFTRIEDNDGAPSVDPVVRYRHAGPGIQGTIVPSGRFRSDFLGAIDTEVRNASASRPATHRYAYRRQTAVNRRTHLMRAGDPLFSGLVELAGRQDWGRADAMWHCHEDYVALTGGTADAFFRCDILVEADLGPAMEMYPEDGQAVTRRRALGRRLDLVLAPQYLTIWLDRTLQPVDRAFAARWFEAADGRSTDLDAADWQRLRGNAKVNEALLAWDDLVARAARASMELVGHDDALRLRSSEAARRLRAQNTAYDARLESRLASLKGREQELEQGRAAFERLLGQSLLRGVMQPQLRVDAIGVLFLSNLPLPAAA